MAHLGFVSCCFLGAAVYLVVVCLLLFLVCCVDLIVLSLVVVVCSGTYLCYFDALCFMYLLGAFAVCGS